ncbi:MAG: phosphatidylserine decarboxylase [Deltaproteobacteria bacterium]|nr:phosphatidylserine decarboxylase [Deltaproteobacteria bacterium]MBF0527466.1 phosphatidylserine decarboxylase [Deltaproteobacteria bacterium]
MEIKRLVIYFLLGALSCLTLAFLYWRYIWFFRNPQRKIPEGTGLVSPADGTVVYVRHLQPNEDVITIKKGVKATVSDIVREDSSSPKIVIGIFMSPFNVHYNRIPLSGRVQFVRHHPPLLKNFHMSSMHWRTIIRRLPLYENSLHIIQNERTVTRLEANYRGNDVSCYLVQIAGGSVRGIESFVEPGREIDRGAIFGRIKIGSQVDLVVTWIEGMQTKVKPGDKVRAGETVLVE